MDNTEYEPCAESQHKNESVSEDMHQVFDVISEDEDLFWNAVRSLYDINVPKDEDERRLRRATEFIDYAEIDFKSAKSLYEVSIFSTSMYHLQQSIEKIVKAYMAYLFNLSNKDFKNIRHDSPKAFFKLLQRFKSYLELNVKYLERINRSHILIKKAAYSDINKLEHELENNKEAIATMDSVAMNKFLDIAEKLPNILNSQNSEQTKMLILKVISDIKKEFVGYETAINEIEKYEERINKSDNVIFPEYFTYLPALYLLALITYPHATIPRYPTKNVHAIDYNENMGIVMCFDRICSLVEKIIHSWKADLIREI